ncbi:MAG TPA: 1-deoxy-D-xylulose-5-phosphate reductoisomerase [bacterium]
MQRVVILGSTGSIGRATLDVVRALGPDRFRVIGLAADSNAAAMAEQVKEFRPQVVAMTDRGAAAAVRAQCPDGLRVVDGPHALAEIAANPDADLVVVGVVGIAGLLPTLAALRAGHDVALANKETLVAGGALVMDEVRRSGRRLRPLDSEHVAIAQCLRGESLDTVQRVLLTASGGAFLRRPLATLADARPADALAHPTWSMGRKITVDSATLMNKGLEVIEAHWLFGLPGPRIEVVIHPQSIVHSLVEFVDGSVKAQLAPPDMRLVIAYALAEPDRLALGGSRVEWETLALTFERPEAARYPCLGYAYDALAAGGTMPAVLNAANESAVGLFLDGRIGFMDIAASVRRVMDAHRVIAAPRIEDILAADAWAREQMLSRPLG